MLMMLLSLARDRMVSRRRSRWRARDVPFLFTKQTRQSAAARVRPNSLCLAFCMTFVRQFTHLQQVRRFSKRCRWSASVLQWIEPEIPLAHPLDNGSAACLCKDIDVTAEQLFDDSGAYRRLMKPLARNWENLSIEFLQPMLHWPQHPLTLAHFGILALCPATLLAKFIFKGEPARALFGGIAAHSFLPLEAPVSSAFALVLGLAGHAVGWPIPRGGSQQISNALAAYLRELGGKIEVNRRIENLRDLPKSRAILLDVSVWEFLRIAGQQLPSRYRRRLESFRHAPGIFKIDYALSEPIPWKAEACRRAGTIHLGGGIDEIAAAEREVVRGKIPERPFVLVAQQSLFDETRAPRGQHTLWAYCHVPFNCGTDMSDQIESQIERFAPGFRDCVLARHTDSGG